MLRKIKRMCPAPGCQVETQRSHFLCFKHWFQLPLETRNSVNAAYNAYRMAILKKVDHKALIEAGNKLRETQACAMAFFGETT